MVLPRQPSTVVLLLLLWGSQGGGSSPVPLTPCPETCVCPDHTRINCSSSGLPLAPRHPSLDRAADLDLSNNLLTSVGLRRPNAELRALRLGGNQISRFSLCLDTRSSVGGGHGPGPPGAARNQRGPRCVSWAPSLLLLSVERNRLVETPGGLGGSRTLQVLQLSYNQISTLEAGDLQGLQQLRELHLHHNLISSLHPQAFMGLTNLTVVDLSFNLLTSISPVTFWSLRVGLGVRGGGNPWRCDCDMASLKRWMALDEAGDQRLWLDMVCSSPSSLAGRNLLQLPEEDLGCQSAQNRPGFHQDVTTDHGSTVLLPCSMQKGSTWWTPKGQVSANESHAGLLISGITERDAGLYICLSQSDQDIVSVYHLKIRQRGGGQLRADSRLARSLPFNSRGIGGADSKIGEVRAMTQDQLLGLAVGLSVFFTFLVAFVLGVLARPCIDVLWQKVCVKKTTSPQPGSVSSAGQGPYDNQAYLDEDGDPEIVSHRERRVTFSTEDDQDENHMYYNFTLASEHPRNLPRTRHQSGGGRRNNSDNSEPTLSQEVEHISDDIELRGQRSLSPSLEEEQGNSTRTQKKSSKVSSSQPVEDPNQQKTTDSASASEPFADRSPHQSNDSGEAFDFPESIQSGSVRSSSLFGSFNHSENIVFQPFNDLRHSDRSSSSSQGSGDESMLYTVNPDTEEWEEEEMAQDVRNTKIIKGAGSFDKQTKSKQPIRNSLQKVLEAELQNMKMVPDHLDSSHSSSCESDDEVTEYTFNQGDEDEGTERISGSIDVQNNIWPKLDLSSISKVKRRLDITVATETTRPAVTLKDTDQNYRLSQLDIGNVQQVKQPVDIKASTDYTSSSDSEEEPTALRAKTEKTSPLIAHPGTVGPNKEPEINVQNESWPLVDLSRVTGVKRRLDITVATETTGPAVTLKDADQEYRYVKPHPDIKASTDLTSSSSDSEEEIMGPVVNLEDTHMKTKVENAYQPHLHLGTVSPIKDLEINAREDRWPELNLSNITGIKQRLDIKVATPSPDMTSSIGERGEDHRWPKMDLDNVTGIKRRLDIKVATETTGPGINLKDTEEDYRYQVKPSREASTDFTSSSSDSEEDTRGPVVNLDDSHVKAKVEHAYQPHLQVGTVSPIKDLDINAREEEWPKLNLYNVNRVKRRLDIKALTERTRPAVTLKDTDLGYRLSQLDIGNVQQVKQPVDIKASTDYTSSSDSEEEPTALRAKTEKTSPLIAHPGTVGPNKEPEINVKNESWPLVDLSRVTGVKRRLDITVATETTGPAVTLKDADQEYRYVKPHPDIKASTDLTSSSSDSEEEIMGPVVNLEDTHMKTKVENAYQPHLHLGTVSPIKDLEINAREDRWPELNLSNITGIKQRLDIKVATPSPDMTSSIGERGEDHRWPKMDLDNVTGIKRRLDIKVATETTGPGINLKDTEEDYRYQVKPSREASTDFTSSSSDSEEDTRGPVVNLDDSHVKAKVEHAYQPHLQVGTVSPIKDLDINAREEEWPKLNLYNVNRVKRRLDIKAITEHTRPAVTLKDTDLGYRLSQLDIGNVQVKQPVDIKASTDYTSSSDSEEEPTALRAKTEKTSPLIAHPGTVGPNKEPEINVQNESWPLVDLSRVTGVKRRLDITVATKTTGPAVTLKDADQEYSYVKPHPNIKASTDLTSSSSDSEEETMGPVVNLEDTRVKTKVENTYQPHLHLGTVSPIKDTEISAQDDNWPKLDLSRLPQIKRRLDFKASTETPGAAVTMDITDNTRWPHLDLSNVTRVKRRLDIKVPMPSPEMTSHGSRVPPQSRLSTSSDDSKREAKDQMVKQERESPVVGTMSQIRWPDLTPRVPRIKTHLDVRTPSPIPHPGKVDPVPVQNDTGSSTSESEDEKLVHSGQAESGVQVLSPTTKNDSIFKFKGPLTNDDNSLTSKRDPMIKLQKYAFITDEFGDNTTGRKSIPGPEITPDLELRWSGLNLGMSRLRKRLDISTNKAASLKVSSSEERVDKIMEWNLKGSTVKESEIDAQNKTWPLVDLGNATGIKRRLDIKVATPPPDMTSNSGESDEDDSWPKLDLDNVTGIKRRLDVKATLPSNTADLSIEERWKMQSRVVHTLESPPPVPDCPPPDSSPSSESEDDSKPENGRTEITEYRTHGPARSYAVSVRETSGTSFKTEDEMDKGRSSVVVGETRERKGLGALRAMSSERKRWDTDHEGQGAMWSSQHNSFQGLPSQDASRLIYSHSGKDLEPHTSIVSVEDARAPGRHPRSLQRAEYQNRLMGHNVQGEDMNVGLRNPPEYLELQNSTLFDLSEV